MKLSQKIIENFEFSQKLNKIKDDSCKYLQLYIAKTSKTFYYIRSIDGKMKFIKLGQFPYINYKDAVLKTQKLNIDIANGTYQKEVEKVEIISLKTLFENFMEFKKIRGDKFKTIDEGLSRFIRLIPFNIQNMAFDKVKTQQLQQIAIDVATSTGKRTANLLIMDINSAYNYQLKLEPTSCLNPAKNVTKFPNNERSRFLSKEELKKFFAELEKSESQDFIDFIKIAIFTGKRKSTILSMEWNEINFANKTWTIPKHKSKNKKEDYSILDDAVIELLNKRRNTHEFVFYSPKSATKHYREPKTAWKTLLKNANIQDLRIHDLRRTLASVLAGQNVSLHMIANILGQSGTGATHIYARFADAPKREALSSAVNEIALAGGLVIDPIQEAYKRVLNRIKNDNDLILTLDRLLKNKDNINTLSLQG